MLAPGPWALWPQSSLILVRPANSKLPTLEILHIALRSVRLVYIVSLGWNYAHSLRCVLNFETFETDIINQCSEIILTKSLPDKYFFVIESHNRIIIIII